MKNLLATILTFALLLPILSFADTDPASVNNEWNKEEINEKAWDREALGLATNQSQTALKDAFRTIQENPGKILAIGAGAVLIYTGGVYVCVQTIGAGCVPAIEAATIGTGAIIATANIKKVITETDIWGNPISDTEWGQALLLYKSLWNFQ